MNPDLDELELSLLIAKLSGSPEDGKSWNQLHDQARPFIVRVLAGLVPEQDVDDLAQEVFGRILRHATSGVSARITHPASWLKSVCYSTVIDYRRRNLAQRRDVGRTEPLMTSSAAEARRGETSPVELAAFAERIQLVMAALGTAERELFSALSGDFQGGLAALREKWGITPGAMAVRVSRLRARIEAALLD